MRDDELDEFRLLFDRHHAFIYRFLYCMVGDAETAQELAQETFFRAYKAWGSFRGESEASTWLCGIARNVARNSMRTVRRSPLRPVEEITGDILSPEHERPDKELLSRELREAVRGALRELDVDKREAFTLKVLQRKSYEEIAAMTGAAIAKLKTDVHRARLQMRAILSPYLESKR